MKIQDIIFFIFILIIIFQNKPKLSAGVGLFLLAFSIPLFSLWIFFTAERLIWYATAFFLISIITSFIKAERI